MSDRVSAQHAVLLNMSGSFSREPATVAFDDGRVIGLKAGELFYVPPVPHDSWVVGDEAYVSLHFLGAEKYATESL
jgi:hypothetical protein